jgi:dienelactone hydrolase
MYQRCLIAVTLVIFLVSCTAPTTEETQDPNVTPEGVRITPDVVYGHKFGMALTFDLFQPENQNGAAVIFLNSGGWVSFLPDFYKQIPEGLRLVTREELQKKTLNIEQFHIKPLLEKEITVFSVRHGSAPKFEMHEIVADLRRAVRFIRFHAEEYGVDPERLGVWGGSAGGHLSLLLGTTGDVGNSDATEEFEKGSGRLAAVVACFPPTDLQRIVEFRKKSNPDILEQLPVLDLETEQLREFSPINFISSDDAPALIIHGDKDPGVPILEGESMHQELLKAGVESKFVTIQGAGHGFFDEDADRALAETVSWFEEHLVEGF